MSKPTSLEEAVREFNSDIFALDAFLFPDAWTLAPHQVWAYKKFERHKKRWVEWSRAGAKSSTISRYNSVKKVQSKRKVVYSGPSYRQSKHPFRYEREFLLGSPWFQLNKDFNATESTERAEISFKANGSQTVALPASYQKIHGERATDLVITEAFAYDKKLYTASVKPMLLGGRVHGGRTITWETAAGVQNSFAWDLRNSVLRKVQAGHPDYCFLSIDFNDLKEEEFFSPEDIESVEADRELDDLIWQQQHLNLWLALTGAFYEYTVLNRLSLKRAEIRRQAVEGKLYVAGGDVARGRKGRGDDSALAMWELDRKRLLDVPPALVYAKRWNDLTAEKLAQEWANILGRFNPDLLVMDFLGTGVSVADNLRDRFGYLEQDDPNPGRRIIQAMVHTPAVINEMHSSLRSTFEFDGGLSMPADPADDERDLVEAFQTINVALLQLADLETKVLPSNYYKFDTPSGRKSDVGMAAAYGWYGVRQLLRVREQEKKRMGSPIVESDLASILIGDDPRFGKIQGFD